MKNNKAWCMLNSSTISFSLTYYLAEANILEAYMRILNDQRLYFSINLFLERIES